MKAETNSIMQKIKILINQKKFTQARIMAIHLQNILESFIENQTAKNSDIPQK